MFRSSDCMLTTQRTG